MGDGLHYPLSLAGDNAFDILVFHLYPNPLTILPGLKVFIGALLKCGAPAFKNHFASFCIVAGYVAGSEKGLAVTVFAKDLDASCGDDFLEISEFRKAAVFLLWYWLCFLRLGSLGCIVLFFLLGAVVE